MDKIIDEIVRRFGVLSIVATATSETVTQNFRWSALKAFATKAGIALQNGDDDLAAWYAWQAAERVGPQYADRILEKLHPFGFCRPYGCKICDKNYSPPA